MDVMQAIKRLLSTHLKEIVSIWFFFIRPLRRFSHFYLCFYLFHLYNSYILASKTRPYSHALVVGVKKAPMPVTKAMNKRKIKNRSRVKAFVKVINYNHIMPTRYSIDVDLKNVVNLDVATDAAKRKNACSVVGKKLEEKYKNGGSKWFFSKLRF